MRRLVVVIGIAALLSVGVVLPARGAVTTLVPAASTWRFHDSGADLGSAWRAPNFADATWRQGPAEFGYGDSDEATTVAPGRVTYYFRRAFAVAAPDQISNLTLRAVVDDGAAVYINGTEVWRTNLRPTATGGSLASTGVFGSDESAWTTVSIPASALVAGANVIAVEVHNSSRTSSDISFDAELIANAGAAAVPSAPTGFSAKAVSTSVVDLSWTPVAGATGYTVSRGATTLGTATTGYFRDAAAPAGTTSTYSVRARNSAGTGAAASVTVTTGSAGTAKVMCRVNNGQLPEISGIVASVRHPGVVWVHNDSGDSARVFALDVNTCAIRAIVSLAGVTAYDFEGLSMGRDAAGAPELWVGDIGDNGKVRANIRLYRFVEPATLSNQTVTPQRITVTWSDGARDCESLLVEPIANGRVFLVSKEPTGGWYQLQGSFRSTGVATTGTRFAGGRSSASDGAIAPDRSRTVVRYYGSADIYTGVPGSSPRRVTLPTQNMGEAIAFTPDSSALYLVGEGVSDLIRVPLAAL